MFLKLYVPSEVYLGSFFEEVLPLTGTLQSPTVSVI